MTNYLEFADSLKNVPRKITLDLCRNTYKACITDDELLMALNERLENEILLRNEVPSIRLSDILRGELVIHSEDVGWLVQKAIPKKAQYDICVGIGQMPQSCFGTACEYDFCFVCHCAKEPTFAAILADILDVTQPCVYDDGKTLPFATSWSHANTLDEVPKELTVAFVRYGLGACFSDKEFLEALSNQQRTRLLLRNAIPSIPTHEVLCGATNIQYTHAAWLIDSLITDELFKSLAKEHNWPQIRCCACSAFNACPFCTLGVYPELITEFGTLLKKHFNQPQCG